MDFLSSAFGKAGTPSYLRLERAQLLTLSASLYVAPAPFTLKESFSLEKAQRPAPETSP